MLVCISKSTITFIISPHTQDDAGITTQFSDASEANPAAGDLA